MGTSLFDLPLVNRDLELAVRRIVGPVLVYVERDVTRREYSVSASCATCKRMVGAPTTAVDARLTSLGHREVEELSPMLSRCLCHGDDTCDRRRRARAVDLAAEQLAQLIADRACACLRDELAVRGGPRPRKPRVLIGFDPAYEQTEAMQLACTKYAHTFTVTRAELDAAAATPFKLDKLDKADTESPVFMSRTQTLSKEGQETFDRLTRQYLGKPYKP